MAASISGRSQAPARLKRRHDRRSARLLPHRERHRHGHAKRRHAPSASPASSLVISGIAAALTLRLGDGNSADCQHGAQRPAVMAKRGLANTTSSINFEVGFGGAIDGRQV